MAHKQNILAQLEGYIQQGRDIATSAQYGVHAGPEEEMQRLPHSKYLDWKMDVTELLRKAGFRDEYEFFSEADGISPFLGGEDLGYADSPRVLRLNAVIRQEMPKKLAVLRKVRSALETRRKSKATSTSVEKVVKTTQMRPRLTNESGKGYFQFSKQGVRIFIGKTGTRKYKLVYILVSPLGTARKVDVVFDAIRESKDDLDAQLKDPYTRERRQRDIINYTMKELQKIGRLRGRVSLKYDSSKSRVALLLK